MKQKVEKNKNMSENEIFTDALIKGEKLGVMNEKIKIASIMINKNYKVREIAKLTKLKCKDIKDLTKEIKKSF